MNKHIHLAVLLIAIFFIFTTCGAKEMFSPDSPEMSPVRDVPMASDPVVMEAMSSTTKSDFDMDLSVGQPAAPIPSDGTEMGYYNFAKTMYM